MKEDTLYVANKWNKPLFSKKNIFDGLHGSSYLGGNLGGALFNYSTSTNPLDKTLTAPNIPSADSIDWSSPVGRAAAIGTSAGLVSTWGDKMRATNPFGGGASIGSNVMSGLENIGLSMAGGMANKFLSSTIGGKLESKAGNAVADIGNTVGGLVGNIPGVGKLAGPAIQALSGAGGGVVNALIGEYTDEEAMKSNNEGNEKLKNYSSNASQFEDVIDPEAVANIQKAHFAGLLNKDKAAHKNLLDTIHREDLESLAYRNRDTNVENIGKNMMDNLYANSAAYGGLLNNPYAFGGIMQSHGADFSNGLTHIDAGGSHSENPNEGVQVGVDPEGVPNLVEEGEVIFNDYVYSNRIKLDKETKEALHFPSKSDLTYAEAAKKLEKESSERPNDPISKEGLKSRMEDLAQQQERQKAEMQAKEAEEAFNSLSDEEKVAVMQQAEQQEQMAQQAMQEQALAQQQSQMSPEEQAMMQQQQLQGAPSEEEMIALQQQGVPVGAEGQPIMAYGGKVNKYDGTQPGSSKMNIGYTPIPFTHNVFTGIPLDSLSSLSSRAKSNTEAAKKATYTPMAFDIPQATPFNAAWLKANEAPAPVVPDTPKVTKKEAQKTPIATKAVESSTSIPKSSPVVRPASKASVINGVNPYSYYTNGSDGLTETPWGFTVNKNGLIDTNTGYTDEYRDLVNTLTADDIREWVKAHPQDTSYLSFVASGNDINKLTTDQWRKGALDGKYGFMHHVAAQIGKDKLPTDEEIAAMQAEALNNIGATTGNTYHALDEDGDYIQGELDSNIGPEVRREVLPNGDTHSRPSVSTTSQEADKPSVGTDTDGSTIKITKDKKPKQHPDWLRYLGLLGPGTALGMLGAGIGKPDYSGINAALQAINRAPARANFTPIGDYMTYKPMDIWYAANRLDAQSNAAARNIMNTSGGNRGTAMAGLLGNMRATQDSFGDLFRKGLEYNDAQRRQVAEYNKDTNKFNATGLTDISKFNANIDNDYNTKRASMMFQAAQDKADRDAAYIKNVYGNINSLFKGIADIGNDNLWYNQAANAAADELFGNLGNSYTGRRYLKENQEAKGGKLNKKNKRRGGLTY